MKRENKTWLMAFQMMMNIIGGLIAAYGLESVLIPNNVSDGGVTGISIVGSQLTGLPLGIFIGVLNIPFVYLGYKQIGKSFAILSVTGIASLSVGTVIMHHVPTIIEGDALLITVVGGIILGFGMGISLRNGGALDGIDMLAVLLSRKLPFGTSDFIFKYVRLYRCLDGVWSSRSGPVRHRLLHRLESDSYRRRGIERGKNVQNHHE